jgi:hypothetical protein
MINGALEIIRGVSSSHIDPLLLPESHGDGSVGYIIVAYQDDTDSLDMLFLKGKAITQCARISRDIRIIQSVESVRGRLRAGQGRALVYLFQATEPALDRFARTFQFEPCLKMQIDLLTRRQRGTLVRAAGCRKGLLELDRFTGVLPSIELYDFETPEQLMVLESRMKRGRLILYDLERNRDLFMGEPARVEREPSRPPAPPLPSTPAPPVTTRPDPLPPAGDPADLLAPRGVRKPPPERRQEPRDQELVPLFEKMFRSFRREAFECFGGRLESALHSAENEVQLLNPEFDMTSLSHESAPVVLDLIETMVRQAPILKRSRLKSTALTLVADLYSRHYDIIDRNGAVDRVEQSYYRLKG